ncbi:uncharacterized protein PHALS_06128 [Plasmopara halstedii]|uniref:Uncharacterized protein n=1 Tax=Plasmopara halstedii TaxID=4781 RepID=A0A0N7L7X6_PLAHL|nr:uncharacterized protein PHALS_06128 [Plasmopara halstedii]CEG48299.1 hypothetical protein PHALS_06128 [Plasmopara halstedii]|eukprot:XP_024584668.1 hypothetical protein PHALS_06128 [Plasmopara halstedii]
MPKRKANWWPPSILSDPDVLSVDDEGRFVLCKICHIHYAVHGGKKPKPVIMNSNFRTRAWDVHKGRTNSHRIQKQQEGLEQNKAQIQLQGKNLSRDQEAQKSQELGQEKQGTRNQIQSPTQQHSHSISTLTTSTEMQTRPCHLQEQSKQTQGLKSPSRLLQEPQKTTQEKNQLQDQEQYHRQEQEMKEMNDREQGHERLVTCESAIKRSSSVSSDYVTATAMSDASTLHRTAKIKNSKRPATTIPMTGTLIQRRRIVRTGSIKSYTAKSEVRDGVAILNRPSIAQGISKRSEHSMAMEQHADSSARWRHMHDDVSRALNATPRKRQVESTFYAGGELRAAKHLTKTETGDLGSNNSERVAKKLRSLNAEYHASNMRHADAYNMRHSDVFDRSSASYKEYWGTLRDVYTSSGTTSGEGSRLGMATSFRKTHHVRKSSIQVDSKEQEADSTTPDDSGSSEDAFKPTVVIHDASLANAIERLTDATSSHIATLCSKETSDIRKALGTVTTVLTDLRVQHGSAFERMIELQEKQLKVMEGILEIKLRKEAARNGNGMSSSDDNYGSSQDTKIAFSA